WKSNSTSDGMSSRNRPKCALVAPLALMNPIRACVGDAIAFSTPRSSRSLYAFGRQEALRAVPCLQRASLGKGAQLTGPQPPQQDHDRVGATQAFVRPIGDRALADEGDVVLHLHDKRAVLDLLDAPLAAQHALSQLVDQGWIAR